MQLSEYIDSITRVKSCLEEREQELFFTLLDKYEELYRSRRATRTEQVFWNQFWYEWDFPKLRDARQLAFEDMAADEYFHHIRENRAGYRNFEKAVALDILCYRLQILLQFSNDFPDFHCESFFNLQSHVQHFFENSDLLPIIIKRLMHDYSKSIVSTREVEIIQSDKKHVASVVEATKDEIKRKKLNRLKEKRK